MNQDQLLLYASGFGLFISVHLAVKMWLASRNREESEQIEEDNPYQFGSLQEKPNSSGIASRLSPLTRFLRPTEIDEINTLRQQLQFAGYRRSESSELYTAFRTTCLLSLA